MKTKPGKPFIPIDRGETIRKEIINVLREGTWSALDISGEVSISEKTVYEHLQHIQKSINKKEGTFVVVPSECRKCGFIFKKREKLKKPGKCPICRGESLTRPLFSIK